MSKISRSEYDSDVVALTLLAILGICLGVASLIIVCFHVPIGGEWQCIEWEENRYSVADCDSLQKFDFELYVEKCPTHKAVFYDEVQSWASCFCVHPYCESTKECTIDSETICIREAWVREVEG